MTTPEEHPENARGNMTYNDLMRLVQEYFDDLRSSLDRMEAFTLGMVQENSYALAEIEFMKGELKDLAE